MPGIDHKARAKDICGEARHRADLGNSSLIQRDTPGFGPRRNAEELRADLAAAKRYRDM